MRSRTFFSDQQSLPTNRPHQHDGGDVGDGSDIQIVYRDHGNGMESYDEFGDPGTPSHDDNDDNDHSNGSGNVVPLAIDEGYHDSDLDDENDDDDDSVNSHYSDDSNDSDDDDPKSFLHPNHPHHPHHPHHPQHSPHKPPSIQIPLFHSSPHLAVLPVLLLEFLALALTRAVLPSLLLRRYGNKTYLLMGGAECLRGILAFFACPWFGKWSDVWGRRTCLGVTVAGTLVPVCSLAFWRVEYGDNEYGVGQEYSEGHGSFFDSGNLHEEEEHMEHMEHMEELQEEELAAVDAGEASESSWTPNYGSSSYHYYHYYLSSLVSSLTNIHRIDLFIILFALSGLFSSTFTLTFAYISDVVQSRDGRVAAYGLALATFGLSFTIGPLLGGYLANVDEGGKGRGGRNGSWMEFFDKDGSAQDSDTNNDASESDFDTGHQEHQSDIHPLGQHRVFLTTLILAIMDLCYIYFILPESLNHLDQRRNQLEENSALVDVSVNGDNWNEDHPSTTANMSANAVAATSSTNLPLPSATGVSRPSPRSNTTHSSRSFYNPLSSLRYLTSHPLLTTIAHLTFLYYTALHAVISTLILYATRQFHLGPHRLGELMAALGLSTMISEAVLVRVAIPALGEKRAMRLGLACFSLQCLLLAVAEREWQLFACAALSIPGNLVYPSVSSLVSGTVRAEMVGRALGAVNGVKSLTEGVGPLLFGMLLTMSEKDALPGWPYFIAGGMAGLAFWVAGSLPGEEEEGEYGNFEDGSGGYERCDGHAGASEGNGRKKARSRPGRTPVDLNEDEEKRLLDDDNYNDRVPSR